ncbi:MAG: hypothetical protein C4520_09545 [Candidatus Abyssobacteria bacterium SURF_5]|uniref:ParB/Sulfiredoxin domain-containing protein n=1 Tax=Abyssobacteria bacterium (strain SURF_5) TaxID=2093360 RepID=A0A3A4P0L2_ABYX5|nr:MAG: hypothetical protein C4520_09545 [Candidatus Abyssubacteria bacterium SURF_5]
MAGYDIKEIPLANLLLDVENPRHDLVESQKGAIQAMLDDQQDKLLHLAEDIIEAGPNPSEALLVIPHLGNANLYVVLEGNRRITALKILETPAILDGDTPRQLREKFRKLSLLYKRNPVDRIPCAIMQNRKAADRWIRLKHTGENQGRGVVAWGAKEVARFNERLGKKSPALQVVDFVKDKIEAKSDLRKRIEEVSVTNLMRLLKDPYVREFLGIEIAGGEVKSDLLPEETLKGLKKIVIDLADNRINVNDIRSKTDRVDYIETFRKGDVPDRSKQSAAQWGLESAKENVFDVKKETTGKRSKPVYTKRKTLIPSSFIIKIDHPRINSIYRELKKLDLDVYPNAGAIAFRVFFELSIDHHIEKNNLPIHENSTLSKKAEAVMTDLKKKKLLQENQLKPIHVAISSPHSLLSIDTMHAYVHNKHLLPKPRELKQAWDEMQEFVENLWA